jgi:hypothetical protein
MEANTVILLCEHLLKEGYVDATKEVLKHAKEQGVY